MDEMKEVNDGPQNEDVIKEQDKKEIKELLEKEEEAFNTLKKTLDDMEKDENKTEEQKKEEAEQLVEKSMEHIRETFNHIKEKIHGKGKALYKTTDFKNVHDNLLKQIHYCIKASNKYQISAAIFPLTSELNKIEKENKRILDYIEKSKRGGGKKTRKSKKAKKAKKARKSRKARKSNRRRR